VLGINWVSDWICAILLIGSYLFKNLNPLLTQHLKKVNTHLCLIINDLKILNIHNWTQLQENVSGVFQKPESITFLYLEEATIRVRAIHCTLFVCCVFSACIISWFLHNCL
jgi:hypothetical protein